MDLYTINYIKNNPLIYRYLREESYWYKYLNRDRNALKLVEEAAKKKYNLTREDKLKKISDNIDLISSLLEVLK